MAALAISVVVVSRNRPDWLRRCLRAIGQLDYSRFQTIVVACPAGAAVARELAAHHIHEFDEDNISIARNIGVDAAAGDIVAFIDDDAVPEPTWLAHLGAVFTDPAVLQAGGITLGRNGISVQHTASRVDASGRSYPVEYSGQTPISISRSGDQWPRLHGTNMALRKDAIVKRGGFDDHFAFYLDETDLTYRIAHDGGKTMFVPNAVVHHASGPSRYRDAARTPRSVSEIAASTAVFHHKHCDTAHLDEARLMFISERRSWILRHMQTGALAPDAALKLIRELGHGYAQGRSKPASPVRTWRQQNENDIAVKTSDAKDIYLVQSPLNRSEIRAKAKALVAQGHRVTLFDYTPNARFHRVNYTDGYWTHTGGILDVNYDPSRCFGRATGATVLNRR